MDETFFNYAEPLLMLHTEGGQKERFCVSELSRLADIMVKLKSTLSVLER